MPLSKISPPMTPIYSAEPPIWLTHRWPMCLMLQLSGGVPHYCHIGTSACVARLRLLGDEAKNAGITAGANSNIGATSLDRKVGPSFELRIIAALAGDPLHRFGGQSHLAGLLCTGYRPGLPLGSFVCRSVTTDLHNSAYQKHYGSQNFEPMRSSPTEIHARLCRGMTSPTGFRP